jgi:hypothetical protein
MPTSPPAALRTLLAGAIDYAGLFPPAALRMPEAVAEVAALRASADRWAFGRFVVPAARLEEFLADGQDAGLLPAPANDPVELSVLAVGDPKAAVAGLAAVREQARSLGVIVSAIETRANDPEEAAEVVGLLPRNLERWVEMPLSVPPGPMIEAIVGAGALPKIRTGGVTADLFPAADAVVAFLREAVKRDTPFKATAGLHHAVRGVYPYTYEPESASGRMYGFLNLLVATALLLDGQPASEARRAMLDEDPESFAFSASGLTWRGRRLDLAALERLRRKGLRSFGSCSFRDPMRELQPLLSR